MDSHDHYDPNTNQCAKWYEFSTTDTECAEEYEHIVIMEEDVNVCAQFYPANGTPCSSGQELITMHNQRMCKESRPAQCANTTLPITCPELGLYPICEDGDRYLEEENVCVDYV